MENPSGIRFQDQQQIPRFSSDEDFGTIYPLTDENDFYGEFAYEDYEKMTGKSYRSYLRIHDDMT